MEEKKNWCPDNPKNALSNCFRQVQTEIDYLNGFLVREGRRLNIPVPCNETVTSLVKAFESSGKLKKKIQLDEDSDQVPEFPQKLEAARDTMLVRSIAEYRAVFRSLAKKGLPLKVFFWEFCFKINLLHNFCEEFAERSVIHEQVISGILPTRFFNFTIRSRFSFYGSHVFHA